VPLISKEMRDKFGKENFIELSETITSTFPSSNDICERTSNALKGTIKFVGLSKLKDKLI